MPTMVTGQLTNPKVPSDLEIEDEMDFNLLQEETSTIQAIDITVKQYAQHKNNSIYVRFYDEAITTLGIKSGDSIMIAFNKNFTQFGIRKDSRGIKAKGTDKLITLQTSSAIFNQFDVDTTWYALPNELTKSTAGNHFITNVTQDEHVLEQIKDDASWEQFIESME